MHLRGSQTQTRCHLHALYCACMIRTQLAPLPGRGSLSMRRVPRHLIACALTHHRLRCLTLKVKLNLDLKGLSKRSMSRRSGFWPVTRRRS